MASPRPRGSSIFSGLILLFIGVLLLLHNYRGFELSDVVLHWWPLVLIFWPLLVLTVLGLALGFAASKLVGR